MSTQVIVDNNIISLFFIQTLQDDQSTVPVTLWSLILDTNRMRATHYTRHHTADSVAIIENSQSDKRCDTFFRPWQPAAALYRTQDDTDEYHHPYYCP